MQFVFHIFPNGTLSPTQRWTTTTITVLDAQMYLSLSDAPRTGIFTRGAFRLPLGYRKTTQQNVLSTALPSTDLPKAGAILVDSLERTVHTPNQCPWVAQEQGKYTEVWKLTADADPVKPLAT